MYRVGAYGSIVCLAIEPEAREADLVPWADAMGVTHLEAELNASGRGCFRVRKAWVVIFQQEMRPRWALPDRWAISPLNRFGSASTAQTSGGDCRDHKVVVARSISGNRPRQAGAVRRSTGAPSVEYPNSTPSFGRATGSG